MLTIAIVEDEVDIQELISVNLKKAGFSSKSFDNGNLFLEYVKKQIPDLVLLDLMLPDMDGLEICKYLKADTRTKNIPVIMLTAKAEEVDRIVGLELGADDYMAKPFSTKELIARIKVVLRRGSLAEESKKQIISVKGISLDIERYLLLVDSKEVETTTSEFKILHLLMSRPGIVFSRDKILDHLWGNEKAVIDRTVDVHVKHIREKLGKYADYIKNVRGIGYKFDKPS